MGHKGGQSSMPARKGETMQTPRMWVLLAVLALGVEVVQAEVLFEEHFDNVHGPTDGQSMEI